MDILGSVVKAVVWGICVLVMIACIWAAGMAAWVGMNARVSPIVATEAANTLATIEPTLADIEALRTRADAKYRDEDWEKQLNAERAVGNAIDLLEKEVEPYCNMTRCLSWYEERYRLYGDFSKQREAWAKDLQTMLMRHANPDNIRSDNWLHSLTVACACVALVLLLYLFFAFIKYFRIGWKRLLALTALVLPPIYVGLVFSFRQVDPLYGYLDLSGAAVTAATLICLLYPFVVIPPLWVLNKKAGRSVFEGLAYWQEREVT